MEGVVPVSWSKASLYDVVDILDSQRIPVNNKERQVRLENAERTFPYFGATGQVGEIDDYIFDGEAVLLGEDAAPFLDPYKAKAYLVSGKYWVNNHAHILRGNGCIENVFLCHQLNVLNYRQYVSGTTRLKLTQSSLKELPIKLPPLKEQRRIVEKIETVFARLDKAEEAVREVQKLLKQYRQSVLKAAVTGELTADWRAENKDKLEPASDLLSRILKTRRDNWQGRGKYKEPVEPNTSDLPDLPEGWEWATSVRVVSVFGNGLSRKPSIQETAFPILRISATRAMKVSIDDLRYYEPKEGEDLTRFWVLEGDLLFTRYNGSAHLVGVCGQMRGSKHVLHPDKLIKARPVNVSDISNDFLELAWNSGASRAHIAKHIKTTSGQQGVAGSDVKLTPFPLPSGSEQFEIASRVWAAIEQADKMANWCEAELKRSTSLRQSILKDAFSGKLVPQDIEDEPASELLTRIKAEKEAAKSAPKRRKAKA